MLGNSVRGHCLMVYGQGIVGTLTALLAGAPEFIERLLQERPDFLQIAFDRQATRE